MSTKKKIIEAFDKFETEINYESTDLLDEILEIFKNINKKA